MGLENIGKKKGGKRSSSSFLKVNKYTMPKPALDLIGRICTAPSNVDVFSCFEPYNEVVRELETKCSESGVSWSNERFISGLYMKPINSQKLFKSNAHNVEVKVAVAGGYSSGKSTFLNALTKCGNLLPTGIEPVSVVNTYLNCSSKIDRMIIKGENLNGDMVQLNHEVLDCIRHSKDSNVNVACVLKKLVIDIPTEKLYDGITFIDTPGYNNSSSRNVENNTTDKETALSSFDEAGVIFWCIDIEAGTITEKDFQVLSKRNGKPYVIVFTKKDKKTSTEVEKICRKAYEDCSRRLSDDDYLPLVIAYSDRDGNDIGTEGSFYFHISDDCDITEEEMTLKGLIEQVKDLGNKKLDAVFEKIEEKFEKERICSINQSIDLENRRKELSGRKDELSKVLYKSKDVFSSEIDELRTVVNEVLKGTEEEYKRVVEAKKLVEWCREYISEYSVRLKQSFEACYRTAENLVDANNKKFQTFEAVDESNVFSAISNRNLGAFMDCLSNGIDLGECNPAGYNVLTWIAKFGNNEMMQILIDNDVDFNLKDKNGYNALEVAAMCHCQNICEMLYKADSSLVYDSENLEELSEKNNFKDWLKENIK